MVCITFMSGLIKHMSNTNHTHIIEKGGGGSGWLSYGVASSQWCMCVFVCTLWVMRGRVCMYIYAMSVGVVCMRMYFVCMYAMPVCMCVVYCLSSLLCWGNAPCYTARNNMLDYTILYYAS